MMYVYSGKRRLCDAGVSTGYSDAHGKPLYTGDIVVSYTVDEAQGFAYLGGLTVVVSDKYTTYSNGEHVKKEGDPEFYVMGIRDVSLVDKSGWRVMKLKGFESVINGEHWPDYGFSFKEED